MQHIQSQTQLSRWAIQEILHNSLKLRKIMFIIFFKASGPFFLDRMNKGERITSTYNIGNVLNPLFQVLKDQRPKSGLTGLKLHHDNAKPHVAKNMISYLETEGMKTIKHTPYSIAQTWLIDSRYAINKYLCLNK